MHLKMVLSSTSCSVASTSPSSSQLWKLWLSTSPLSSACVSRFQKRASVASASRANLQVTTATTHLVLEVVVSSSPSWRLPAANVELARKLELFWSELAPVLNSGSKGSRLPDVAQLSYTVQTHSPETQVRQRHSLSPPRTAHFQYLLLSSWRRESGSTGAWPICCMTAWSGGDNISTT